MSVVLTDLSLAARSTVLGSDLQETVSIDLEGGNELGLATGHGGNTVALELAEETVVTALSTLTLVDGEGDGGLVVLNGGEDTRLVGGDGGVTGNDDTEDVTLHGDTEGEGSDVEKEEVGCLVRCLAGENSGLNSSTVGNSLIGVDGLVELTATEVLGDEGLDLGDTSGTADKDDVVDLLAGHLRILQHTLNGVESGLEEGCVNLLETSTSDVRREVLTLLDENCEHVAISYIRNIHLEERVNLNSGLSNAGQCPLSTLASTAETTESTGIVGDIETRLLLELLLEVIQEVVIEVLTTQVSVTSGGLDGEHTTGDVEERDIESSSTKIENKNILFGA